MAPQLKIQYVPTDKLVPYADNARTHSEEQVNQLADIIQRVGFTNPILVDGDNVIIAGHGRLLAAQKLGLDKVPTIQLSHMTPEEKDAYIIADNKLAMNAGWNIQLLYPKIELLKESGFDIKLLGFNETELGRIADDFASAQLAAMEEALGNTDEAKEEMQKPPSPDIHQYAVTVSKLMLDSIVMTVKQSRDRGGYATNGEALFEICEQWRKDHG